MIKRYGVLLAATVLLCSACVKADLAVSVNDDESGTFSAVSALNAKVLEGFGGLPNFDDNPAAKSTGDFCKDVLSQSQTDADLKGAKVEPYRDGDFCGVRVTSTFKNLAEARNLLGSTSSSAGSGLEDLILEKSGAGYKFSADWSGTGDLGGAAGGGSQDDRFAQQFLKGFSFIVRVKLPGGQVKQNADAITDDGTMVWNLDPLQTRRLEAQTDLAKPVVKGQVLTDRGKSIPSVGGGGGSKSSKTWLYIVGLLVVVAAVAGFFLIKRNKAKTPAVAGLPSQPGGAPLGGGFEPNSSWGATPAAPAGAPMAERAPWDTPSSAAPGAPLAPSAPVAAPRTEAMPAVDPAPVAAAPAAATAAAGAAAADTPQWDAARNAYIQYDRVNARWMQYDQIAAAWKPIDT